ncbi:MAG: 30S ribosome-binding factor RbfA [Muribaculaceae bacterium]|nr:30S ribosome-binding factor RbfA [Muribaculaceae bacterium]
METKRQAKIARYIQKELSEIFRRQTSSLGGVIVSVSQVRITPDLSIAKAYLSIFPPERSEEILENIKKQSKTVRYELAQNVKEVLRKCPELQFYLDDSLDYIENIDRLLGPHKADSEEEKEKV